ncbi:MAG: energy transducer TonB [Methylococcales bacterium]
MIHWFVAFFLALVVSVGLFWFMQWMVMNNNYGLQQTSNQQQFDFIRIQKDTTINKKQRRLKPMPQPEPPKQPKLVQTQPTQPQQSPAPQMNMPNIDIPITSPRLSANLTQSITVSKNLPNQTLGQEQPSSIPLVTMKPRYPVRALSRNIEGWVVIEFTITPTGTVIDAKVTDAKPEGIFDRAALNAIVKWKFKPKMKNGRPVAQRATQRLKFNVEGRRR